jgi:CheY-like chemotaxis protein
LVIEDDQVSRESLAMLLGMWGHRVQVAGTGAEGLEKALSGQPEVAVVDLSLPEMDGYTVARRLREVFGDGIRLIALTGHCAPEDRQRVVEAMFDRFMAKPGDLDLLARWVAGQD